MYRIRKKMRFEAAHVLDSSYSKDCQTIHGHSYIVEFFFQSKELNEDGMVIDFGEAKKTIQSLIDQWDHALIVSDSNKFCSLFPNGKIVNLLINPTAENMAEFLLRVLKQLLPSLYKVRVHETESGYAEFEGD